MLDDQDLHDRRDARRRRVRRHRRQVDRQDRPPPIVAGPAHGRRLPGRHRRRPDSTSRPGQRAIAVQVDQVTGVGTVIRTGDYVDLVVGFRGEQVPGRANPTTTPSPSSAGINSTSVKLLAPGHAGPRHASCRRPPPAEAAPSATGAQAPAPTLTGQQEIVILSVTAQQAEVIKFAQLDGAISLVLRSPQDFVDEHGQPDLTPDRRTRPASSSRPWSTSTASSDRSSSRPSSQRRTPRNDLARSQPRPRSRRPDGRDGPPVPRPSDSPAPSDQTALTKAERRPPMADQIRVLIVDDIPETRDHLTKLLGFESDIEVVGSAASGARGHRARGRSSSPDVVLMDINMPDMDGITATEQLAAEVPDAAVVMMSVQGEADYLRRSMLAGAREFLVKPFSSDELTASIRQVWTREREKQSASRSRAGHGARRRPGVGRRPWRARRPVVAVFSPKGGVGRTTIAVNIAVAAATELGKKVVLVDASFQFGDVGVLLNLNPKNKSIADLVPELEAGEPESLDTFVITHSAGVRVLLAPPSPEKAELITPGGRQARARGAPPRARPGRRRLPVVLQRARRWRSSTWRT